MTWTPRSNWINVKTPTAITGGVGAVGDGVADDTAAIQAILTWVQNYGGNTPHHTTIYFPAGTYKITSSISLVGTLGVNMIGCGSNTIISWAGTTGGAMFEDYDNSYARYVGLTWNGNNTAACAYEFNGGSSPTRHENESFKNITASATYSYYNGSGTLVNSPEPATSAIISGMRGMDSEVSIWNCAFSNCTTGLYDYGGNYLMWNVEGCEFENCGQGINFSGSSGMIVANSHFSHTAGADITGGHLMRVRRCTSEGSGWFYDEGAWGWVESPDVLEDCWVDNWTDYYGAVYFSMWGPNEVFDCSFTNPPANASSPICANTPGGLLLSNNYASGLPAGIGLANSNGQWSFTSNVQPGLRGPSITSPNQTFLNSNYLPDSTHIIDVSQPPYSAPSNYNGDAGPAIQAAITAAKTANNGSIVYIPGGVYQIGETLNVTGSNYTIQGEGLATDLVFTGASGGTMMSITTPKSISIQFMDLCVADAVTTPISETSTGTSSITYDEIYCQGFNPGSNPGSAFPLPNGKGLVLSNLPAGSTVYMPHVTVPLTVVNCGAAQILGKFLQMGLVNVSGTGATTGFIGSVIAEGGWWQQGAYNITVNDNQSLILNDYYTEGAGADLSLSRGAGTGTGRVTIQGINEGIGNAQTTSPEPSVTVNNYQGRLFYGSSSMLDSYNGGLPIQITQTGTNPIDMLFPSMVSNGGLPTTSLGTGANLVMTQGIYVNPGAGVIPETPNPLTQADYLSLALGLDHIRQLGAVDLSVQYGITTDAPPIAQYPFENNLLDMTTSYNGTNHGATFVPGMGQYAANFNGTSTYATIPKSVTGTFSISMWVSTTDAGATGQWYKGEGLVDAYTAANAADWGTALNNGLFSFGIGNPDTTLTSTTAINDGNWHQVVATRNTTTGAMQIYIDGVLNNSVTGPTGTRSAAGSFRVGSIQTGVAGGFLNGTIDEVQVYNYVLSATDVATNYNHTKASLPPPSGLVAYWNLDETTGPLSRDSSGSNITGTWVNNPYFTTDKPSAITFPDAGSLMFNLSNQRVNFGIPPQLPSGQAARTICGWAKNAGLSGYGMFASYGTAALSQGFWIGANGTSLSAGSCGDDMPDIPGFWDGNWHFIALTYDGTTAKLYADGVLKESAAKTWTLVPSACYVGCYMDGGAEWYGPIDDVRIYNRALPSGQVAALAGGHLNPYYDVAADWNGTSDSTSNTWCYGTYTTLTSPSTFNIPSTINYGTGLGGMAAWAFPPVAGGSDPNIEINQSTSPIFSGGAEWLPGKVSVGPYQGPAVARFTVPTTGTYNISATFQTDQMRGVVSDGTTAYVYVGTTNKFTQALTDPGMAQFGAVAAYSASGVSLTAGQTVDFVVGNGSFTTQVTATVTPTSP